jgi:hypothetical protein
MCLEMAAPTPAHGRPAHELIASGTIRATYRHGRAFDPAIQAMVKCGTVLE